ncbi:hypothetical protein [Luedemannella helvata]|uniref:Uncharacterized protein n=1 Tax=Luedemannella helvata TaxID=349315 RepID=A0ABN2KAR3_9ACTN
MDPRGHVAEFNRLVLVTTSLWRLPSSDTQPGHGALLRRLLNQEPGCVRPGHAWLRVDPEPDTALPDAPTDPLRHLRDDAAADLLEWLQEQVRAAWQALSRAELPREEAQPRRRLAALRHRVVLDAQRFLAVTEPDGPARRRPVLPPGVPPFHVVIELRFDHLAGAPVCEIGVSVWSGPPAHPGYCPPDLPDLHRRWEAEHGTVDLDLDRTAAYFDNDIAVRAHRLLATHLRTREFRVFGARYELPVFWVAVPTDLPAEPDDYLTAPRADLTRRLLNRFLEGYDTREAGVTQTVINARSLVLRKLAPGTDFRPRYLILPARPGLRVPRANSAAQAQEITNATIITALTDVEARLGAHLNQVQSDLEIWKNHLSVYRAVAERGFRLWDGLSTHLPVRRWFRLGRVHRGVELLHQILLQGVADLAQLGTFTRESLASIDELVETYRATFEVTLSERRHHNLRTAIASSVLVRQVRRLGDQTLRDVAEVKQDYEDLLKAITYAFDERRVRESDALQKSNFRLSVVLALITVVTVLDALVDMKPSDARDDLTVEPGWVTLFGGGLRLAQWAGTASALVGGATLVALSLFGALSFRRGRLGSRDFRRIYDGGTGRARRGLWHFLKDSFTESLNDYTRRPVRHWSALDADLADRFAALWDRASAMDHVERDDRRGRDIRRQSRRVEQWGLHTLLLTERARRMYRYRLPLLTCAYRACTLVPGSFVPALDANRRMNMVADSDFALSLRRIGLTWEEATDVDRLVHLLAARSTTVAAVLHSLREHGLDANLLNDPAAREEMLRKVRATLG